MFKSPLGSRVRCCSFVFFTATQLVCQIATNSQGQEFEERLRPYLDNKSRVCNSFSVDLVGCVEFEETGNKTASTAEQITHVEGLAGRFAVSEVKVQPFSVIQAEKATNHRSFSMEHSIIIDDEWVQTRASFNDTVPDYIAPSRFLTVRPSKKGEQKHTLCGKFNPFDLPALCLTDILSTAKSDAESLTKFKPLGSRDELGRRKSFWLASENELFVLRVTFAFKPSWLIEEVVFFAPQRGKKNKASDSKPEEVEADWRVFAETKTEWKESEDGKFWLPTGLFMSYEDINFRGSRKYQLLNWKTDVIHEENKFDLKNIESVDDVKWSEMCELIDSVAWE